VLGWRERENGPLWSPNTITEVELPTSDLAGEMVITSVRHSLDDSGGEVSALRLMRPDAFAPEPTLKGSGLSR
jgi:prophage tail gpP-like protein